MVLERDKEEAFNDIYHQYYSLVYYTAYKVLHDSYMAQDVVQETFIKVFSHFHTIRQQKNKGAWIKTISRNKAIDYYRRRAVRNEILDDLIESIGAVEDETDGLAEKSVCCMSCFIRWSPSTGNRCCLFMSKALLTSSLRHIRTQQSAPSNPSCIAPKMKLRLMVGEAGMTAVDRYA